MPLIDSHHTPNAPDSGSAPSTLDVIDAHRDDRRYLPLRELAAVGSGSAAWPAHRTLLRWVTKGLPLADGTRVFLAATPIGRGYVARPADVVAVIDRARRVLADRARAVAAAIRADRHAEPAAARVATPGANPGTDRRRPPAGGRTVATQRRLTRSLKRAMS